jgi:hypothetical protein
MPKGTPLLSESERREFGAYLRLARGDRSVREVAAALAGVNVDKADINGAALPPTKLATSSRL